MDWLVLIGLLSLNALTGVFCLLMLKDKEQSLRDQATMFRAREQDWIVERERLQNRAMTNTWQDYAQMSAAMQTGASSTSDTDGKGLSDEEELRRWGGAVQNADGDVFVEQDLRSMGLFEGS